jgi:hypothetical protein
MQHAKAYPRHWEGPCRHSSSGSLGAPTSLTSQPSAAAPLQLANQGRHTGGAHTPLLHVPGCALGRLQFVPQAPQFKALLVVLTCADIHTNEPAIPPAQVITS